MPAFKISFGLPLDVLRFWLLKENSIFKSMTYFFTNKLKIPGIKTVFFYKFLFLFNFHEEWLKSYYVTKLFMGHVVRVSAFKLYTYSRPFKRQMKFFCMQISIFFCENMKLNPAPHPLVMKAWFIVYDDKVSWMVIGYYAC